MKKPAPFATKPVAAGVAANIATQNKLNEEDPAEKVPGRKVIKKPVVKAAGDDLPHMDLLRANLKQNDRLAAIERGEIEVPPQKRVANIPQGFEQPAKAEPEWKPGQ